MSAAAEMPAPVRGPADQFPITYFTEYAAPAKEEERICLTALADKIRTTSRSSKGALPWLKLATFGDIRTDKNSLRHDRNVLTVSGIECDYDAGQMTVDEAVERMEKQGVLGMVYTSPSHRPDKPRWRVVCPLSEPIAPDRRAHMVGRLNGLMAGRLAGESFTLSQSYYYGSVDHNPAHRVEVIDGQPLDQHDDLDEAWIGKPNTGPRNPGSTTSGRIDEAALEAEITSGIALHLPCLRLAGAWSNRGMPYVEARAKMMALFDAVPIEARSTPNEPNRWQNRRADVDRCLLDIYGRDARARDAADAAPEPEPPPSDDDPGYAANQDAEAGDQSSRRHDNPEPPPEPNKPARPPLWVVSRGWQEQAIPQRPWIARGFILRGHVTMVIGPPAAGKSSLMMGWCVAIARGLQIGRFTVEEPMRVLNFNVEDDGDEQQRRMSAACRLVGAEPDDVMLGDQRAGVVLIGPHDVGTLLRLDMQGRALVNTEAMAALVEAVEAFKPDVLMLDPFVELHDAGENDNTAIRGVLARLRSLAKAHNMGVVVMHHTRKGAVVAGDPEASRGAGAIIGAARVLVTVTTMTKEEGGDLGVPPDRIGWHFRVDDGKLNYTPPTAAEWFERISYHLENGDDVAAAAPWVPPDDAVSPELQVKAEIVIKRGVGGEPYSAKLDRNDRSVQRAFESLGITSKAGQTKLLAAILAGGFTATEYRRPNRVTAIGLRSPDGFPLAKWADA